MVAMVRKYIFVGSFLFLLGCDHFPGPTLRNEFPNEIRVSIQYSDGTKYTDVWPSCKTVHVGANEVGSYGLKSKNVTIDDIVLESAGAVVHHLDRMEIAALIERAKKDRSLYWILTKEGVKFSKSENCPVQVKQ